MPHSPTTPDIADARLHSALGALADARAHVGSGVLALILALLAHLLARAGAAWHLSPSDDEYDWACEEDCAFLASAHATLPRTNAACWLVMAVEAGILPGWVLGGTRNRGMRLIARPVRHHPRTRPVRPPPDP